MWMIFPRTKPASKSRKWTIKSPPDWIEKNYGQSLALAAGIDYAEGEYIITMDGDLQNDPSDIPQMLEYAVNGEYDLVTGIRQKEKTPWLKNTI